MRAPTRGLPRVLWDRKAQEEEEEVEEVEEEGEEEGQAINLGLTRSWYRVSMVETWVGCQGSKPHFRRYPCGMWTLFHVLTVQAKLAADSEPQEVLENVRNYVHEFFGCRLCAEHFDAMAQSDLGGVRTLSGAVLWLWLKHNLVNNRIQWPSQDTCPDCHGVERTGEHRWEQEHVLPFLLAHFSSDNLHNDYLEDESVVLAKQRKRRRRTEEEEGEEDEEEGDEEEEPVVEVGGVRGEEKAAAAQAAGVPLDHMGAESAPWANNNKPDMVEVEVVGRGRWRSLRKPGAVLGMRLGDAQEDIVDLDSFTNQHFRAKALRAAAASHPGEESHPEAQAGRRVGMVGLEPVELDFDPDAPHRAANSTSSSRGGTRIKPRGRWISVLNIGFSRLDISLCVILYFLSSLCLMAMYLFFKYRL
ncbi:hypothetical protein CRUP_002961, partial [Coryphaenoides rupestris]